jgi:hypothetical protein
LRTMTHRVNYRTGDREGRLFPMYRDSKEVSAGLVVSTHPANTIDELLPSYWKPPLKKAEVTEEDLAA